jgi:lipopolysaccharide export system protein LptA
MSHNLNALNSGRIKMKTTAIALLIFVFSALAQNPANPHPTSSDSPAQVASQSDKASIHPPGDFVTVNGKRVPAKGKLRLSARMVVLVRS